MSEKNAFVVVDGTACDRTTGGQGRSFPAELLGHDAREIARTMRTRLAAETRDRLPELLNRVRAGSDDGLLHVALFGDVDGVRAAVLDGLNSIDSAKGSIANFAQAISLLKIREAAPALHSHLRALPPDAPSSSFRASAISSSLLILDENDEVAAANLAVQLSRTKREEKMFAAHRACECDHGAATSRALKTLRVAATGLVDDEVDVFVAAAPLLLTASRPRAQARILALLTDMPKEALLLRLIRDALDHGTRDETTTSLIVERGLAHSSPGVRLDSVTLLASLPHVARVKLAKGALIDEPDRILRDMLNACALEIV